MHEEIQSSGVWSGLVGADDGGVYSEHMSGRQLLLNAVGKYIFDVPTVLSAFGSTHEHLTAAKLYLASQDASFSGDQRTKSPIAEAGHRFIDSFFAALDGFARTNPSFRSDRLVFCTVAEFLDLLSDQREI